MSSLCRERKLKGKLLQASRRYKKCFAACSWKYMNSFPWLFPRGLYSHTVIFNIWHKNTMRKHTQSLYLIQSLASRGIWKRLVLPTFLFISKAAAMVHDTLVIQWEMCCRYHVIIAWISNLQSPLQDFEELGELSRLYRYCNTCYWLNVMNIETILMISYSSKYPVCWILYFVLENLDKTATRSPFICSTHFRLMLFRKPFTTTEIY